ncbi:MAG: zinc metallopeptidase [Burkholderiales bacterium]|nr:zinc metallopeptidase [Burkholderiales bacterium]
MRWDDMRRSENVEDRRGALLGGGTAPVKIGGLGLVIVVLVSFVLGINPLELLGPVAEMSGPVQQSGAPASPRGDEQADFVRAVVGDTEDTWRGVLAAGGRQYQEPRLVLYRGQVASACGFASAAVGPFYCPGDRNVYLDLEFFDELAQRFGAPGEFARAYVVAHEVGHHVQALLGVSDQVVRERKRRSPVEANALSVRQELQADCFAGVWGHYAARRGLVDTRDIEAGLRAAAAIGDDRLQRRAQGYVVPEAFTHGSSEQRVHWFRRGLESGDVGACDTFGARQL